MWRVLDTNFNRASEGLRLLEDVARFILNDANLSRELKNIRHKILSHDVETQKQFLKARNSEKDVGAFAETRDEVNRASIIALITANAKRVEESLRVLEEFGKLSEKVEWRKFKEARFAVYEIEKNLISKLLRRDKIEKLRGLYLILDTQRLNGRSEIDVAQKAIQGGAKVIQLRDKVRGKAELVPLAEKLKELCVNAGVLFVVNDYADVALAVDADGVHLGQNDLPISVARRILPLDKIVGISTRTLEQALKAQKDGADYIAVGAIYSTSSKSGAEVVGLERLRQIKEAVSLPMVAIGGIFEYNVGEVKEAGAESIAVISAVLEAEDVEEAARRLAVKFERGVAVEC